MSDEKSEAEQLAEAAKAFIDLLDDANQKAKEGIFKKDLIEKALEEYEKFLDLAMETVDINEKSTMEKRFSVFKEKLNKLLSDKSNEPSESKIGVIKSAKEAAKYVAKSETYDTFKEVASEKLKELKQYFSEQFQQDKKSMEKENPDDEEISEALKPVSEFFECPFTGQKE